VGPPEQCFGIAQVTRDLAATRLAQVSYDNPGALLREGATSSGANATATAGDHRHFAVKSESCHVAHSSRLPRVCRRRSAAGRDQLLAQSEHVDIRTGHLERVALT